MSATLLRPSRAAESRHCYWLRDEEGGRTTVVGTTPGRSRHEDDVSFRRLMDDRLPLRATQRHKPNRNGAERPGS